MSEPAAPPAAPIPAEVPGLRTLRSGRFRVALALTLLLIGTTVVGLVLLFTAAALVTVSVAWLPLAMAGAALLAAVSLFVIWSRPSVPGFERATVGVTA